VIRWLVLSTLAFLTLACRPEASEDIMLHGAWAGATPPGSTVAAVYMTIESRQADTLISASSPAARKVEMHTSMTHDGTMMMHPLERIELPAGKPFVFHPGGPHFMMIDLNAPLEAGTSFPLTLSFLRAGERTIEVEVLPPGAAPPAH
jgi:copper(I)-binding protein